MKYGFTTFDRNDSTKKIVGTFTYIIRDENQFQVSRGDYRDAIEEAEDKDHEIFFEYDLINRIGTYMYPVHDEKQVCVKLKNLSVFSKIVELRKIIKYDKTLKYIDSAFSRLTINFPEGVIIDGESEKNVMFSSNNIIFNDHFLMTIRNNNSKILNSYLRNSILAETQILNSIQDENQYNVSAHTREFLSLYINNLLDKGFKAERYKYIIERFEKMLNDKSSESEWQEFIFEHYRFIFPEYLFIEKEYSLITIDQEKKYVDFLLKNQSSELLLEIKLPNQQVMSTSKDRNNFYFTASTNKALIQTHRYYVTYKHEKYDQKRDKNIKAMLLIGFKEESSNDNKLNNDFELIRSMYKNVEIITYSELLNRINNLYEMLISQ